MNKFKDLKVWQKSVVLAVKVYEVTGNFPDPEKFGLLVKLEEEQFQ